MNSFRYYLQFTYEIYLIHAAVGGAQFNPEAAKTTTKTRKLAITVKYIPYAALGGFVITWIACLVLLFKLIEGEGEVE